MSIEGIEKERRRKNSRLRFLPLSTPDQNSELTGSKILGDPTAALEKAERGEEKEIEEESFSLRTRRGEMC